MCDPLSLQEVEEQEKQQRMSESSIRPKGKAKKGSRQAKLTSQSSAVQSVSKPSPFAEMIPPQIPEFKIPVEKKERKPKAVQGQPKGGGGLKQGKLAFKEDEMKTASAFDDDSGDEMAPTTSKPVQKMKKEAVVTLSDSEDEGMEVVEQKATKTERPARKRPTKVSFGDDDDDSVSSEDAYEDSDDDDFSPVKGKKSNAAKSKDSPVKSSKSAGTKKAVKQISKSSQKNLMWSGSTATTSQEEAEEKVDEPARPKKLPAKPKAAVQKRKGGAGDSEGDDIGAGGSKKTSKAKTAGKRRIEKESDNEDETVAVKRKRPAPQKGVSKKVFNLE